MLLIRKVQIASQKQVERGFGKREQPSIFKSTPASLQRGRKFMPTQQANEFQWDALIDEHDHRRALSKVSSSAPINTATAASRFTEGKHSRNSSKGHPLSRCSKSEATGTR